MWARTWRQRTWRSGTRARTPTRKKRQRSCKAARKEGQWRSRTTATTRKRPGTHANANTSRILEEAAEEQDDSTEDSNDDSECRIDTDYTADESARHQAASSAHDTAERHAHLSHLDPETHLQTLETLRQASGKRLLSAALLASAIRRRQSSVTTSHRPPDCDTRAPSGTSFLSGGGRGKRWRKE